MTINATVPLTDEVNATEELPSACMQEVAIDEDQLVRASTYSLIAALMRNAPDDSMLQRISGLVQPDEKTGDDLLMAMSTLGLSAKMLTPAAIEDEFHDLFIGLGKGEVVPYGSWYLTGFLMEKPLSDLRDDLARLGYQRSDDTSEPEDHVAALCEVMSMMIAESVDVDRQQHFYTTHMENWLARFFADLTQAKSAVFYKSLGRFGAAFCALESEYFDMSI